jgi:hypothetical protein
MCKILVFGEDYGHEVVLQTLIGRLAHESHLQVEIRVLSATGGHGKMMHELKEYMGEIKQGAVALPDLFVVGRDANCRGYAERCKEIQEIAASYGGMVVPAVPDPHVERWLLIDSKAFAQVLGKGCQAPNQKCDRDRYKLLLNTAVREAGVEPLLGGIEFAEDIILNMNLDRAAKADNSFAHVLRDLRAAFTRWRSE